MPFCVITAWLCCARTQCGADRTTAQIMRIDGEILLWNKTASPAPPGPFKLALLKSKTLEPLGSTDFFTLRCEEAQDTRPTPLSECANRIRAQFQWCDYRESGGRQVNNTEAVCDRNQANRGAAAIFDSGKIPQPGARRSLISARCPYDRL